MAQDIVVTIPRSQVQAVELEEADVARRLAAGETGIEYYWAMSRLPRETPRRIYFCWNGAVRAYHEVTRIRQTEGRLYMDPTIHPCKVVPMQGFQGYRYYKEPT